MRTIKPPHKYGEANLVAYALSVADNIEFSEESFTYEEEVSYNDSGKWMIAMQEEMESLHKNGTWNMVRLPEGKKSFIANGCSRRKKAHQVLRMQGTR